MEQLRKRIIGQLIGLVRATEGNEDEITPTTDHLLIKGLYLIGREQTAKEELLQLSDRILAEKKRLIPNCFACASSCDRTTDLNMDLLQQEAADIREIKLQLLGKLQKAPFCDPMLYKALYYIGMEEIEKDDLLSLTEEVTRYQANM